MEKKENISLLPYTTFGIEAKARKMLECRSLPEATEAAREAGAEAHYVLGGGSNTLLTGDYAGTIIMRQMRGVEVTAENAREVEVRVGAGEEWDALVKWSIERGLQGAENLSGIPGNVGASPVQNIGAYGAEAKDVIRRVHGVMMTTGKEITIENKDCHFGYRDSIFKRELKGEVIITDVTYVLRKGGEYNLGYGALREAVERKGAVSLQTIREAVMETRNAKLPDPKVQGNAGSFFKNPEVEAAVADSIRSRYPEMPSYALADGRVKVPAGWLIEQSGWKGRSLGRAAVHDKQALVLVNKGGATGAEIIALCDAVRNDVRAKFGIELVPEVNFL